MTVITCSECSQARSTRRRSAGCAPASGASSSAPPSPTAVAEQLGGECVEHLDVLAQLGRGAGERLGDPAGEHLFQQRQHLVAQPDPGEPRIDVVRVVPDRQPVRRAGGQGDRPPHPEQWPQTRADPRRACRPASAGPSRGRARAAPSRPGRRGCGRAAPVSPGAGGRRAGRRSGPAGPRPRARQGRPPDAVTAGLGTEPGQQLDGGRCALRRTVLQTVIDDRHVHRGWCRGEGGDGEGERVGAPGAGDQRWGGPLRRGQLGQRRPDGAAHLGEGRVPLCTGRLSHRRHPAPATPAPATRARRPQHRRPRAHPTTGQDHQFGATAARSGRCSPNW